LNKFNNLTIKNINSFSLGFKKKLKNNKKFKDDYNCDSYLQTENLNEIEYNQIYLEQKVKNLEIDLERYLKNKKQQKYISTNYSTQNNNNENSLFSKNKYY
jgi:hypothetical protein